MTRKKQTQLEQVAAGLKGRIAQTIRQIEGLQNQLKGLQAALSDVEDVDVLKPAPRKRTVKEPNEQN